MGTLKLTVRKRSRLSVMKQKRDFNAKLRSIRVCAAAKQLQATLKLFVLTCESLKYHALTRRARAEEALAQTEADLEKQLGIAGDLTKQVRAHFLP
jgi:hypothetical protein